MAFVWHELEGEAKMDARAVEAIIKLLLRGTEAMNEALEVALLQCQNQIEEEIAEAAAKGGKGDENE